MLRRVLTRIWNKEGVARVGILFEYKDEKSFVACQTLLDKYHAPKVKTFVNKVVGSRGLFFMSLQQMISNNIYYLI